VLGADSLQLCPARPVLPGVYAVVDWAEARDYQSLLGGMIMDLGNELLSTCG
jgi:hypothetical protein